MTASATTSDTGNDPIVFTILEEETKELSFVPQPPTKKQKFLMEIIYDDSFLCCW